MNDLGSYIIVAGLLTLVRIGQSTENQLNMNSGELENFVNPEDLEMIMDFYEKNSRVINDRLIAESRKNDEHSAPAVDCFGIKDSILGIIKEIFSFNLKPASSSDVNTLFYFSSRKMESPVQIYPGDFGMELVDFEPTRKTVMIVHGFMSYGGAGWVTNMTKAYLDWEDVNVIAVDWSRGSNSFKYWRAVANTRTVGKDIANFMKQLENTIGVSIKNCHFIGHSLGAHIVSFASNELGKVDRITGLDPALPCFETNSALDRLDPSDADFVDIIHTNGQQYFYGFGFPFPAGHADFYPNGGTRQPGCFKSRIPIFEMFVQAQCSHGRAYVLFTESMTNRNCRFRGSHWDLTATGLRKSVGATCPTENASCPEMGIGTPKITRGRFLVITSDEAPFCMPEMEIRRRMWSADAITYYLQQLIGHTAEN